MLENNPNRISGNTTSRQSQKRTFSESDSSSRTERHLCSFSHLWIINYLSSYIDDSNSTCLQSESFSPVNTPYSNTRWSLKLYPRGLNEKQHPTNNMAIFLKYCSGTMATIKAKTEFSVVNRNNELVMLRSTNFHTFSSGNDWGYSEFLDGNYLNSRRNELLTDDRLRIYVRIILVDEKDTETNDLIHYPSEQSSTISKTQPSACSSLPSSSSATPIINSNPSPTSSPIVSGLFRDENERFKSFELLSNQMKILLDDERFSDIDIHVIPKQENINDNHRKLNQQQPSCSSCHCLTNHSSLIRRTTRSTTSLLLRIAQTSSDCSTSSSDICSSSSYPKHCLCICHDQENHIDLQHNPIKYSQITPLATFHAHKFILIARSSSFANQIHSRTNHSFKSPSMNLYIDDLEPSTVRTMLIYIYTGRLPTINDDLNPIDLFRASVKYNLTELRDVSKSTMLDILKIDNAIEILEISDQTNDHLLKQQLFSFIQLNASAISKTTTWIEFTKHHPDLIIDAFRSLGTSTMIK